MKTHLQQRSQLAALLVAAVVLFGLFGAPSRIDASISVHQMNLIDGGFDVNGDGVVGPADNLSGILLFHNDAAPIRADIISGFVDLDEDGLLGDDEDNISNTDLTRVDALGFMKSVQVQVIDARVDVDGGGISTSDDLTNVRLIQIDGLPAMEKVDIIDSLVDVNQDGVVNGVDDASNLLWAFNDAALLLVNIIDGKVDSNQNGVISLADALKNADLSEARSGGQFSEQVSIIVGHVDIDQDGNVNTADDATDVRLVRLNLATTPHQVDIIDGKVDVDESGAVNTLDDLNDVLLLFNDAAPIRVDIIDGKVDVNEGGAIGSLDDLSNVDLNGVTFGRINEQVDIINGLIDVDEDGLVTTADDATNIKLLTP